MESAFSTSFAEVRIHEGGAPDAFDARGITRANHIYLPHGVAASSRPEHRRTLAHELAHVLQHRERRVPSISATGDLVNSSRALEAEAETTAARIVRGATPKRPLPAVGRATVHASAHDMTAPLQLGRKSWNVLGVTPNKKQTTNKTYKAKIGKPRPNVTKRGIAKRQLVPGDAFGDSPVNLGLAKDKTIKVGEKNNPRMLARQVASWKLAKGMGMGDIHAQERYADSTHGLYGVSENFEGGKTLEDWALEDENALADLLQQGDVQKQLSDLQLFDAISGQSDRHLGNIMLDPTGKVKGIDNDQSFPPTNERGTLINNQVQSFDFGEQGSFRFNQGLIDHGTAQRVLAMKGDDVVGILKSAGYDKDEKLSDAEISAAVERLDKVKERIRYLESKNQLVGQTDGPTWGAQTFDISSREGAGQNSDARNNVFRAMNAVHNAARGRQLEAAHEAQEAALQAQEDANLKAEYKNRNPGKKQQRATVTSIFNN